MFGIPDPWIWSAFLLCILSAVACIAYGLYNWNKGGNDEEKQILEESQWEKAENDVKI